MGWGVFPQLHKHPTTNDNYNINLLYISNNKTHKEILDIPARIRRNLKKKKREKWSPSRRNVCRLNRGRGWTIDTICVGDGYVGGVPESWSVRKWMGVKGDGWVTVDGCLGSLASHEWARGLKEKPPSISQNALFWHQPKWCVLDPTWWPRLMWHIPKRCV